MIKKSNINRKVISLILTICFSIQGIPGLDEAFALAPWLGTQRVAVRREAVRLRLEMGERLIFTKDKEDEELLRKNKTRAVLLSHGKVLVAKELKDNNLKLIRVIIHEEIEALMQIVAKKDYSRYSDIRDLFLSRPRVREAYYAILPDREKPNLPWDLMVNDLIARAFEILILKRQGLIRMSELSDEEIHFLSIVTPLIQANKHNYFTGEFWDSEQREMEIRVALANRQSFYQVASTSRDTTAKEKEPVVVRHDGEFENVVDRIEALYREVFDARRKSGKPVKGEYPDIVTKTDKGTYKPTEPGFMHGIISGFNIPDDGDTVILDAGSGLGFFILMLAVIRPDVRRIEGIESDLTLYEESIEALRLAEKKGLIKRGRVFLHHGNFNNRDKFEQIFDRAQDIYLLEGSIHNAELFGQLMRSVIKRADVRVSVLSGDKDPVPLLSKHPSFKSTRTGKITVYTRLIEKDVMRVPRASPAYLFKIVYEHFRTGKHSLQEICDKIRDLHGTELKLETVDERIQRLVSSGLIKKDGKGREAIIRTALYKPSQALLDDLYKSLVPLRERPTVEKIQKIVEQIIKTHKGTIRREYQGRGRIFFRISFPRAGAKKRTGKAAKPVYGRTPRTQAFLRKRLDATRVLIEDVGRVSGVGRGMVGEYANKKRKPSPERLKDLHAAIDKLQGPKLKERREHVFLEIDEVAEAAKLDPDFVLQLEEGTQDAGLAVWRKLHHKR